MRDCLAERFPADPLPRAVLGHAFRLDSWRSLVRGHRLVDGDAIELLARCVICRCEQSPAVTPRWRGNAGAGRRWNGRLDA